MLILFRLPPRAMLFQVSKQPRDSGRTKRSAGGPYKKRFRRCRSRMIVSTARTLKWVGRFVFEVLVRAFGYILGNLVFHSH